MLIIAEGVDCAGKTTLLDRLETLAIADGLDVHRLARGRPSSDDAFVEYEQDLVSYRASTDTLVLCDRWAWGEMIYGPLYRGSSILDVAGRRHIDLFLRARGAVQTLVDLPDLVVQDRIRTRGDDMIDADAVPDIMMRYRALAADVGNHVLYVDPRVPQCIETLYAVARFHAEDAAKLPHTETYIGPVMPEILFLGESRGTNPPPPGSLPAFVPRPATSGHYLLAALERRGVPPTYGLVNALEDDWVTLWKALNEPRLVALGLTAANAAKCAGVPHGTVQHPAYIRRFKHDHAADYVQAILMAAANRTKEWL